MCTAISFHAASFYFGRNLDLEYTYDHKIVVTPRNFPLQFRNKEILDNHYAMIGMAVISQNYPLYFDATNEKGLSAAGLNFPGNAYYFPVEKNKINLAPFELIPWILGKFASVAEVLNHITSINLWNENFSKEFPLSPLHWIISDSKQSITLESTESGLHIYDNPVGVLTNNPSFDYQMTHLTTFLNITAEYPSCRFSETAQFKPYSLGMGAIGLPGDPSSPSRFVKAVFVKQNSPTSDEEENSVSQFFHILGSVNQQKGITKTQEGLSEYTLYSSCCNTNSGVYYYTTYHNSRICAVNMHHTDINAKDFFSFTLSTKQDMYYHN